MLYGHVSLDNGRPRSLWYFCTSRAHRGSRVGIGGLRYEKKRCTENCIALKLKQKLHAIFKR